MKKRKEITKNNLKFFRKKIPGLTQQKLAALVDENWQNIQRYESMTRELSIEMARKLAPHLGLKDPFALFTQEKNTVKDATVFPHISKSTANSQGKRQKLIDLLALWDGCSSEEKEQFLAVASLEMKKDVK